MEGHRMENTSSTKTSAASTSSTTEMAVTSVEAHGSTTLDGSGGARAAAADTDLVELNMTMGGGGGGDLGGVGGDIGGGGGGGDIGGGGAGVDPQKQQQQQQQQSTLLCASCDYCRSRKTKCDGKRPCANCLFKYMKKHKIASAVGIDPEEVDCMYSPAKRRGPTPGRSTNSLPDAAKIGSSSSGGGTRKTKVTPNSAGGLVGWPNNNQTDDAMLSVLQQTGGGVHESSSLLDQHPYGAMNAEWNQPLLGQGSHNNTANGLDGLVGGGSGGAGGMSQMHHQLSTMMGGSNLNPSVVMGSGGGGGGGAPNNVAGLVGNMNLPQHFQSQQEQQRQQQLQQQQQQLHSGTNNNNNMQVQLQMLQQQIQQQQMQQQQQQQLQSFLNHQQQSSHIDSIMGNNNNSIGGVTAGSTILNNNSASLSLASAAAAMEPTAQRRKLDQMALQQLQQRQLDGQGSVNSPSLPRTIIAHTHLIDRDDPEGSRLRAYYKLSMDELFRLPATPTDEEYCNSNDSATGASGSSGRHLAALSATRFAEVAIGAIVHNEIGLAMELCNAVVHCLRESIQEKTMDSTVMFEVAKAYFLLGVFRAFRGDMARYFKYRRVCLTYLSKLDGDDRTLLLLAAMSYLDSWTYMMYNGYEDNVPNIDGMIPPVLRNNDASSFYSPVEAKYGVKTDVHSIACNPKNRNWLQGPPAVYLNDEAPLHARSLDAISCAVRYCCDQANSRFASLASENDPSPGDKMTFHEQMDTPTTKSVLTNENELCNRNTVASAYLLMRQYESNSKGNEKCDGLHVIISAMDAFLESDQGDLDGGFTDSQIQSLLSVCNSAVENPLLLHHAGPTYHLVTNAAILLCHLLNGMYAMKTTTQFGPMEATMFEEVLDTLVSVLEGQSLIDLGETTLCPCRSCQGFVLLACSPSVAAERARSAQSRMDVAVAQEAEAVDLGELSQPVLPSSAGASSGITTRGDIGAEFDLDDDALLTLISSLISS